MTTDSGNNNVTRHTISFGISVAACSLVNVAIVIAKETSKAVNNWMQRVTGHHWITHLVFVLLLFAILGWGLAGVGNRQNPGAVRRLTHWLVGCVIASLLILAGFYLLAG